MKRTWLMVFVAVMITIAVSVVSAAPLLVNYQGKVESGGAPFTGTGYFRFAIVFGTTQYWSNDGNDPPTTDVALSVDDGLFNVILGDTHVMNGLDASVFEHETIRLRVWFDDGTNGMQQLTPDQQLTSASFAIKAGNTDAVSGHAYDANWPTTASNIQAALGSDFHNIGGVDDDQPDDDSEVPDDISIQNARLYAPTGNGNVGIGTNTPSEKLCRCMGR